MFRKITNKNERQSVWHVKTKDLDRHYLCSTSIDHSEVMIFRCDAHGEVEDWLEEYCNYHQVLNHHDHMDLFLQELNKENTQ